MSSKRYSWRQSMSPHCVLKVDALFPWKRHEKFPPPKWRTYQHDSTFSVVTILHVDRWGSEPNTPRRSAFPPALHRFFAAVLRHSYCVEAFSSATQIRNAKGEESHQIGDVNEREIPIRDGTVSVRRNWPVWPKGVNERGLFFGVRLVSPSFLRSFRSQVRTTLCTDNHRKKLLSHGRRMFIYCYRLWFVVLSLAWAKNILGVFPGLH
jgi:hypothetical protein